MNCSRAATLLQLYLDGRLQSRYLPRLEAHLHECPACRADHAYYEQMTMALRDETLPQEPEHLSLLIMNRIAALEAAKAREAERRAQRAATVGRQRLAAFVVALAMAVAIYVSGSWATFSANASRNANSLVQVLLSPGPNSVAWIVWAGGAAVAMTLTLWFARADASAPWRRALAERLPQLPQMW